MLTEIDLVWQCVLEAAATVLSIIAALIGCQLLALITLRVSSARQMRVEQIADLSLSWALRHGMTLVAEGWDDKETVKKVLQAAAIYAGKKYGDQLRQAGTVITSAHSQETFNLLEGLLDRRYPHAVARHLALIQVLASIKKPVGHDYRGLAWPTVKDHPP